MDRGYTADVVSHPRRLCGLIAKKQAAEQLLTQQKQGAVTKIEKLISGAVAIRTDYNALQVDWMVNEFRFVMKEIKILNPLELPDPEKISEIEDRLQKASVGFMYGNSSTLLRRIDFSQKLKPKR